ncbi:response regulator, partial [Arthrobacter sp. CG_A4]|uniref:response regulator n=1 Tax=Arthrobacter sp. CG_A4 TaxID=3071706 RepID=UPI002E0BA889|nr:PAS domain S-box-containing protein [Arthrobacter sp. CG_A4]
NRITPADMSDPRELIKRAAELSAELGTPIEPGFEALVYKAKRGIEDNYELTYVRKDGSRFPAIVSVTALRDAGEEIIGYLLIGTDNTVGKQVEAAQALLDQQLRDQQFYTRSLIESNIDALMTTDPYGTITDVNQQMMTLTECSRAELIGAPFRDFFTDPARADAGIARVLAEHKVSDYELTVRARNGGETFVSYNAATFHNRDHTLQGVFAAARDVTDRRRIELTLQEKNVELEHASRMKSEFLATMSHELRTPLNSVIGFSEALKDGLLGELTASQREYIGDIFTSGQHLLSLINDILDLSKVEAGMMNLELEPVDVGPFLSNALSIVREKAAAHSIGLDLELDEHLGVSQLDMRKTKQIVYNLLSNAVKFSSQGGRVSLRARPVPRSVVGTLEGSWPVRSFELAATEFAEFLEIRVTDSGMGISQENMAKLFQAFTQIDSTLARQFEGTGLGLAMVKQMTELLGGTVAMASKEGEGACFAAWIPLRGPAEPASADHDDVLVEAWPVPEVNERVALVVEDDDKAAELVRVLLEADGFSVLRAASAEEALQMAPQQCLDLITVDIQLPGIGGWEFLSAIRKDTALGKVPVVVISGTTSGPPVALAGGAAAVLEKPISRSALKEALTHLGFDGEQRQACTVLVVDDDPKAVEVIAAFLPAPAYMTVRAYGGQEAIVLARRMHPDLILLDLMMPEVTGYDVVHALKSDPGTVGIPILVITAKQVTARDLEVLNVDPDHTIHILAKAGFNHGDFLGEVRRALPRL